MLISNNITVQFGAKPLFENVSVKFGDNNRYGLIGANGCGKSTYMKVLAGVFIIDNGEDTVKLMHNHEYDLVLMDVHLPGINGTEATKQIREFDNTVPIIALTAISLDENRETLLSYGMNDVITKPFIPEEFYTIISKYIASVRSESIL